MRRYNLLFWLTALASAVPILATRFLPFADLPEHVAAIATLSRMMQGLPAPYVVDFAHSQYLLYHALGAVVTVVVRDAVLANQLLLAVVAVLWPVSLRALLRASGRDPRFALFATMVFYNRALAIGFLPYLASVPLAVFALALVVKHCREPSLGRSCGIALLSALLFYMHVSSFVLFCAIAVLLTLLATRSLRETARRLLLLVPSAVAALVWWLSGSLAGGRALPSDHDVGRMNVARSLSAFPLWTYDVWESHRDEACAAVWWIAFGVVMFLALRSSRGRSSEKVLALVPVACAATMYVLTPFRVGSASMLNVRLAPLVTLFAIVPVATRGLAQSTWAKASLALAAVASLATSANTTFEARRAMSEMVGNLDTLLARAEPGTRLAMLNFERRSPRTHFWPYIFAGSYHRARGGSVASWGFSELAHWPLHYAPGEAPPRHRPFWIFNSCAYRYGTDGDYYDYALVQGDADPFEDAPGPRFVRVASSGVFTLYAKDRKAPVRTEGAELGACAPRPRAVIVDR